MDPAQVGLVWLTFILSGMLWTSGGYIAAWRKNHNDPNWKGFNLTSLRNDIILGAVLGGGGAIYSIMQGTEVIISTAQEFFLAIGSNTAIIALVDKFIVGGLIKK